MTAPNADYVREAMILLGAAWRGDWGDFDGRTLRDQLNELADALTSDEPFDLRRWTISTGICPEERAWFNHCRERSEGVSYYSCDHAEAYYAERVAAHNDGSGAAR